MATWRFEIEEKHAVVREKFIEADNEDATRALAEAEIAKGCGTWDELYDYTDREIRTIVTRLVTLPRETSSNGA